MTELLIVSGLNIVCFLIGAMVGQRVFERKPVVVNPIKEIQEYKEEKENDKESEKFRIIAENIDAYDGTAIGQKKIGG